MDFIYLVKPIDIRLRKVEIRKAGIMYRIRRFLSDSKLFFKRIFWRLKYGFDITETWSLDYSLAKWLEPRIRHLANNTNSYPPDFESSEKWTEYLLEIADGIKKYIDNTYSVNSITLEEELNILDNYKKCMQMVTDRLHNLWD